MITNSFVYEKIFVLPESAGLEYVLWEIYGL